MSSTSWALQDVDPALQRQAALTAERLGISLADYLTFVLSPDQEASEQDRAQRRARSVLSARRRSDGVGARRTFADPPGALSTPTANEARASPSFESRDLDARLNAVAQLAQEAHHTGAELKAANEALKRAVAEDFFAFAEDTADTVNGGLATLRAEAEAAAAQADAALASLAGEFVAFRERMERRAAEATSESRTRMQAAFADAAKENAQKHRALSDEMARVEACTLAALEKLAADISVGDEKLARQAERTTQEVEAKIEHATEELGVYLAELRGQQSGIAARLQLIDRTLGNLSDAGDDPLLDRVSALEEAATLGGGVELEKLARRLERLEARQRNAMKKLREDTASLSELAERRLGALEKGAPAPAKSGASDFARRLAALEKREPAGDLENLRQRLEERVLGLESRCARALEQLSDALAQIDVRISADTHAQATRSA
jgi:hypothetical protein